MVDQIGDMQHDSVPTSHPPAVTIRQAVDADAIPLQRFVAELFSERLPVVFRRDLPPTVEDEHQFIEKMQRTSRSLLLVADAGDEIVGMLDFHGHQRPQRAHAGEFGFSVAKSWRGMGVGSRLLAHLFEWAVTEKIRRVELRVLSNNAVAISLYERLGFVREGVQRDAVEVDGAYVDIVLMVKLL